MERKHKEASAYGPLDVSGSAFGKLSSDVIMRKGRMGDAYIKSNRLTREEVEEVVKLQNRLHIRFGEAAVRLGLLTEDEVKEVLDKQFNYATFGSKGKALRISPSLAIVHDPGSDDAEAIKRLRSEILVRIGKDSTSAVAIAVVSPLNGEGKSHIAASLAIAFAQLNIQTMLIDANLRNPVQHKLFGLTNQTGLSTMLAKRSPMTLEAVPEVMPDFWVLGSGPLPPNPAEILSAPKLSAFLEFFAPGITIFIVDTPPTMRWSDAQSIARQTGRALFVARENMTRLTDLKKIKQEMITAGVEVLGTVFNQPPKSARGSEKSLTSLLKKPFVWMLQRFSRRSKGDA